MVVSYGIIGGSSILKGTTTTTIKDLQLPIDLGRKTIFNDLKRIKFLKRLNGSRTLGRFQSVIRPSEVFYDVDTRVNDE